MGEIGALNIRAYELTLSRIWVYLVGTVYVETGAWVDIPLDGVYQDYLGEYTPSMNDVAEAGSGGGTIICAGVFIPSDVGKRVWNRTDGGHTTIAAYVSANQVTLTADIGIGVGDNFAWRGSYATVLKDGWYYAVAQSMFQTMADGDDIQIRIRLNAGTRVWSTQSISGACNQSILASTLTWAAAGDIFTVDIQHNNAAARSLYNSVAETFLGIFEMDTLP